MLSLVTFSAANGEVPNGGVAGMNLGGGGDGGGGARQFVRDQLDRLGLGRDLTHIPWGSKRYKLPPSRVREAAG